MTYTRADSAVQQYLELDVVHRWGGDNAVKGGEAMLVANLLAV